MFGVVMILERSFLRVFTPQPISGYTNVIARGYLLYVETEVTVDAAKSQYDDIRSDGEGMEKSQCHRNLLTSNTALYP